VTDPGWLLVLVPGVSFLPMPVKGGWESARPGGWLLPA
jgi:hypothetical protein